jgi:LysM repeat protein
MNSPNPLLPQGSLERHSKGTSTVRIAIFTIISIHAVFFAGLLMQGCRRDDAGAKTPNELATNHASVPPIDAGYYPGTPDTAQPATPSPATSLAQTTVSEPMSLPLAVPTEPLLETKTYTVAKGDNLSKIAKANGISLTALTKANPGLDAGKLKAGQKLQIPPAPVSTAPPPIAIGFKEPGPAPAPVTASRVHVVKPGETLTRIAKQHGTTPKALRAANNLKGDRVVSGQKLKLPMARAAASAEAKPVSGNKALPASGQVTSMAKTNLR